MGFLNHATNNIIIDAVLTERGREYLSQNNGTFRISSFSFGDDEVDYTLLEKYGISIGKEKIEKNTPIFEANPNENIALRHPCISFPNPLTRIEKMPSLTWSNNNSASSISLFDTKTESNQTSFEIEIRNQLENISDTTFQLDTNISDTRILVKMHNDLIKISGQEFLDTDTNNIATYLLSTDQVTGNPSFGNQRRRTFTIFTNGVVTSEDFTKYAVVGSPNIIKTKIQIVGQSSGSSLIIPVNIAKV